MRDRNDRNGRQAPKSKVRPVIPRYETADGDIVINICCGCCGKKFMVAPGGSAFCGDCVHGTHKNCKMAEIMGIRS